MKIKERQTDRQTNTHTVRHGQQTEKGKDSIWTAPPISNKTYIHFIISESFSSSQQLSVVLFLDEFGDKTFGQGVGQGLQRHLGGSADKSRGAVRGGKVEHQTQAHVSGGLLKYTQINTMCSWGPAVRIHRKFGLKCVSTGITTLLVVVYWLFNIPATC